MFKLLVLFSVLALAAAKPGVSSVWPATYSAVPAVSSVYGSPVIPAYYSGAYSPYVTGVHGVAHLSQAPNSPAVVLNAVNGVPLDTPEVVASRIAHYQAKALAGVHRVAKRSVVPVAYSSVIGPASIASVVPGITNVFNPLSYSSPYVNYASSVSPYYGYTSVVPKALSVHPW